MEELGCNGENFINTVLYFNGQQQPPPIYPILPSNTPADIVRCLIQSGLPPVIFDRHIVQKYFSNESKKVIQDISQQIGMDYDIRKEYYAECLIRLPLEDWKIVAERMVELANRLI